MKGLHSDGNALAEEDVCALLPECDVKELLLSGVAELRESGYAMTGVFEMRKHRKGVFTSWCPFRKVSDSCQFIGVDPGQIDVASVVRSRGSTVESRGNRGTWTNMLRTKEAEDASKCFMTQRYRYKSLVRLSEKTEARRRTSVCKGARDLLSVVSPTTPRGCEAYPTVVCVTLSVMVHELVTYTRRREMFARFRAQARAIDGRPICVVWR